MTRQQVEHLLSEIGKKKNISSFVVLGSLSIFAYGEGDIPGEMTLSNEVDGYAEIYPGHDPALAAAWGQGSAFERQHGYYFDSISPKLPTLPEGWESRLIEKRTPSGVIVKYADPNDVAVSKYARGEPKDRKWVRAGLAASMLSLATIEYRSRETLFLDQAEHERVKAAISEDRAWLEKAIRRRR
ncbi:MAG: DUF6036 family nucleotidyltransferase [Betaproteobacteria bacterium]